MTELETNIKGFVIKTKRIITKNYIITLCKLLQKIILLLYVNYYKKLYYYFM
jgi:hypothetical protein